jgi:hypothetical protein
LEADGGGCHYYELSIFDMMSRFWIFLVGRVNFKKGWLTWVDLG